METIDTNKVYYRSFDINGEKKIMAYKVLSIVFDIETEYYTFTINVAQNGVRTFRCKCFDFYASPLDWVNRKRCCYLMEIIKGINADNLYAKHFVKQLKQQGFEIENGYLKFYYFNGDRLSSDHISIKGHKISLNEYRPNRLMGTYDLLTGEVKAQFNPRSDFKYAKVPYKSKQECLDAQMPEVVEFEDETQKDVEVSFNFNVNIKAKDAKEAQRKFILMLQVLKEE